VGQQRLSDRGASVLLSERVGVAQDPSDDQVAQRQRHAVPIPR